MLPGKVSCGSSRAQSDRAMMLFGLVPPADTLEESENEAVAPP